MHIRVADDALRRVGATGLELRLDEDERLPARRRERDGRRKPRVAEMNETSQVMNCGANGSSSSCTRVDPLEHDDAVVVAESRMELPVADVQGDHARRATLQQAVREPARRRAEVEATLPAGSTPSASSACASFSPPRETNRGGRSTASSTSSPTCCPGLSTPERAPRGRGPEPERDSRRARAPRARRRGAFSPRHRW